MTRTEGRILIKLIHRQTGKTAYDNIRILRSGWKAFWYNTTANVFKLSLKAIYNPKTVNEDYLVEDIIQRGYIDDSLEYQESKLGLDYYDILQNRGGEVNVEMYKAMFSKQRKRERGRKKS